MRRNSISKKSRTLSRESSQSGLSREVYRDDEDEEHEPIQFAAKPQILIDPTDTKILKTGPGAVSRPATIVGCEDEAVFDPDEDEDGRGGWGNKLDFLFSCISVSVGLGNVWRFPYLCYKNGGGTFLIIYFISMFACGIPIFFQEVAIGQYLGSGGLTMVGQLVPILQGVGYATMTIVFFLDIYYCIIIAWTLFYLLQTIIYFPTLPWGSCGNHWNSKHCFDENHETGVETVVSNNFSKSPVEEYWDHRVLNITTGIDHIGGIQWELFGTLILGWVIVYLIIWKGLHSSGKVIWFTALFPYVIMTILLVRSVTLPGASLGLWRYITPVWEKFYHSETWIDSATQIFFAYSIGTGALPALGSYNKFYHNCVKDSIITCFINTGTCLFAGCITFSILGHMAHTQGASIETVVNSGPGLVFVTYPEVVLKLPGGSIWALTFFTMLVTIGIDSEFCIVESLITGIVDMWPNYLRPRRRKFTAAICFLLFLLGIPMTTQGGAFIFQLMDFYSASGITILWCCFFQTIAIGWIFGTQRFAGCVEQMTGYVPNFYWKATWGFISPSVMASIFIFYIVRMTPVKYGDTEYPISAHIVGLFLSLMSMLWIPGYAIYYLMKQNGQFIDRLYKGLTPVIKSNRIKAPAKNLSDREFQMSESSARLLKNSSFATPNASFNIQPKV